MDQTTMLSVGIDIGTSTSQVIFSRLKVENTAGYFSVPSVSIIDKKVVYESPIYSTPLIDDSLIDGDAIEKIIEKEYQAAGVVPSQVETGAVIITGESARKENAQMVLEKMSRFAGDFVVSTAGPDLESVIAGQGSGAQQFSEENGAVVVNLDIGGGTTNLVLFDGGEVKSRGCLDIGGRQVKIDRQGKIAYISKNAYEISKELNLPIEKGEIADKKTLEKLCGGMCRLLEQTLGIEEQSPLLKRIETNGSQRFHLEEGRPVRYLFFSGGVADCIYQSNKDPFAYGDIGVLLGEAIRKGRLFQEFKVIDPAQTIRATVIGAGSYTTAISGSTISYSYDLFPMKNIPVLKLSKEEEDQCWNGDIDFLKRKAEWFLKQSDTDKLAAAIEGRRDPEYSSLKKLADTLIKGLGAVLQEGEPLLIIVRQDMGKALGQLIRRQVRDSRPVAVLDSIKAEENNFIDFGRPIMDGLAIPVVVKTLIFS